MNRQGVTLLEIVAATVLLAMASAAALVALRLNARTHGGVRPGYAMVSSESPTRIGTADMHAKAYTVTDLGPGPGTTAEQSIHWYQVEANEEHPQPCLRFTPVVNPVVNPPP
jgi:prepilin-type N-terminal cleavage/methylation domain-containing protein